MADKSNDFTPRPGKKIRLDEFDTKAKSSAPDRDTAEEEIEKRTRDIGVLQDLLYAENRQALLVVLQGMDGSGKDGTVSKIFDHVNPAGVQVTSFKSPTNIELAHDFLWRVHQKTPPLGMIGVFNRSHYEDVLIVRVHADTMLRPDRRDRKNLWQERYDLINSFEDLLNQNNTRILKFFLHISKGEQRDRFLDRQKNPDKNWKISPSDFSERKLWDQYIDAYEKMLTATNTESHPWHIIPADHKWIRNYHISRIVHQTLKDLNPKTPPPADPRLATMKFE